MTLKRRYNAQCPTCNIDGICPICKEPIPGASQFSEWLREQPEIGSDLGFGTTNIDFLWRNWKTNDFMLIEEKRRMAKLSNFQEHSFRFLGSICKLSKKYRGFLFIQFENTNPDDGKTFVNGKEITRDELIRLLRFGE